VPRRRVASRFELRVQIRRLPNACHRACVASSSHSNTKAHSALGHCFSGIDYSYKYAGDVRSKSLLSPTSDPTLTSSPAACPSKMNVCPTPGCDYPVALLLCRGARTPRNKGLQYEACIAPGDNAHFLRWRRDLPQLDVLPPQTFQQALAFPLTPQQVDPLSSPAKTPTSTVPLSNPSYTVTGSPSAGSHTPSNLEPVADDAFFPLGPPPAAPPPGSLPFQAPNHTRMALNAKGKLITACNGPICGGPLPVHPAIRPASDCTHQFCKKCCQRFQRDGASACMMPSHRIVPTSASAQPASQSHSAPDPTLPPSTIDGAIATASGICLVNSSQDFSRPLRLEHYERRANAEIEQQTTVNRATEIKEAETLAKSTVAILYWKVRLLHLIYYFFNANDSL
jgi:hypothetical protein